MAQEFGDFRPKAVVVETVRCPSGASDTVTELLEGESIAVIDITRESLGVLSQ